jgi:zinc/manganese transport system substrate-binding protein
MENYLMKPARHIIPVILALVLAFTASCQKTETKNRPSIVVTYSILGSVVKELVNGNADVIITIPNGLDLHEWEPSAKDIEKINKASLIVRNGLNLEAGMERSLSAAGKNGVKIFTASDHITVRHVDLREEDEHEDEGHSHEAAHEDEEGHHHHGDSDPHLWTDPVTMKAVVEALVPALKNDLGIDITDRAEDFISRLDNLNIQIADTLSAIPAEGRKIVTGHESMGYFSQRYGFEMTGVIIPSLSSQASVSAADLVNLKKAILENGIKTIFTEQGTSPAVARAIGDETGVRAVELNTHALPSDGSYFTFLKEMADTIAGALK